MRLPFRKLHGLGNDFAFFDGRDLDLEWRGQLGRRLCDRHRGLGADGLLIWRGSLAEPEMLVINADGSEAEMCGNGLRCFAKALGDELLPAAAEIVVRTRRGGLGCLLRRAANGLVAEVEVELGRASADPRQVPLAVGTDEPWLEREVEVAGRRLVLSAVTTGNPHAVVFSPLAAAERRRLGPALEVHPLFPDRANVEFARLVAGEPGSAPFLEVEVFERGVGWTEACGTGAAAAVYAAQLTGRLPIGAEALVRLPGGVLAVAIDAAGRISQRGPAAEVFRGEVEIDGLSVG